MVPAVSAEHVVRAAARCIHGSGRLDLGALSRELGISRVTLHRRVGNREQLMGEALWYLAERTFAQGVAQWERAQAAGELPAGAVRSLWVMAHFRHAVGHDPGQRHLLDEEPGVAMRLLTDPHGRVQPRVIEMEATLMRQDVEAGVLHPVVDVDTLAYAVVRLGESFLYADVLASRTPDLEACTTLVDALVTASAGDRVDRSARAWRL